MNEPWYRWMFLSWCAVRYVGTDDDIQPHAARFGPVLFANTDVYFCSSAKSFFGLCYCTSTPNGSSEIRTYGTRVRSGTRNAFFGGWGGGVTAPICSYENKNYVRSQTKHLSLPVRCVPNYYLCICIYNCTIVVFCLCVVTCNALLLELGCTYAIIF
jgi:hypothetical protein